MFLISRGFWDNLVFFEIFMVFLVSCHLELLIEFFTFISFNSCISCSLIIKLSKYKATPDKNVKKSLKPYLTPPNPKHGNQKQLKQLLISLLHFVLQRNVRSRREFMIWKSCTHQLGNISIHLPGISSLIESQSRHKT